MNYQATPLSFKFLSFGEDEITSTEELFIIDNNIIVFNQDIVNTAQIGYKNNQSAVITLHLKDGITVEKTFDTSLPDIKEVFTQS